MEEDDDMLVVVIGDEDDDDIEWNSGKVCAPIQVKEEPFDADDVMQVIEAAQRYGRPINLRTDVFIDESDGDVTFEQAIHNIKIERYDTDDEVDHNAKDFDSIAEDFDHNAEDFDHSAEEFDHNAEDVDHNIEDFDNYLNNYGYEALDENNCDDPDYQVESDNDNYNSDFNSDLESVGGQSKKKKRVKMLSPSRQRSFVEDLRQQYPELERNQKALIKSLVEVMRSNKAPKPPKGFYILSDFMYECFKCGKMTNCIPAAERHYQEKHGPRYLVCYACGVDFRSKTNLYKHEKICQARDAMIVLKARALFLGRKGRSRPFIPDLRTVPVYKNKGFKRFPCTRCSATFTSKNNLVAHENMHRGVRPYCCDQCPSAYTSAAALTVSLIEI
ncbi:zinc finger and SCAN domain-containing protein 2-like [Ostrinia nubilalis]|uniref:zinc finger and SCAN domain-containing protein 2-like n=1 Tax=Ostrinia nubilalis TaxID=29057 RepID=UPI003082509B